MWRRGGGGVRLNFSWFPGGGGVSMYLHFAKRGEGSSKIWIMDQNFSRPPDT